MGDGSDPVVYSRIQDAARAAFSQPPDRDGIRRVRIIPKGLYRNPWFCLTPEGFWFFEERSPEGIVPDLTTIPRPCPSVWIPEEC